MNSRIITDKVNNFLMGTKYSREYITILKFFRKLLKQDRVYVSIPIERYYE